MSKASRPPSGAGSGASAAVVEDTGPTSAAEPAVERVQAAAKSAFKAASDGLPAEWLVWLRLKLDSERIALFVVLGMGVLLFFPFLGTLGLWDPWETHYGEVAREMITRDDYVYPYWESAYFFSKPALPLWLMALGMQLTGAETTPPGEALGTWTEWGIRTPFALIAILCLWAVYRIGRQLKDRATGVLAAFVLGACPQFIFIGKQAMVDMPLVGFMTAGLALFIAAVFDGEEDGPPSRLLKGLTVAGMSAAIFPQLFLIGRTLEGTGRVAIVATAFVGAGMVLYVALAASRRDCWLAGFYTLIGLSCAAKGLAVLVVVGPTVIFYMLFTADWDILRRSKVLVGGTLFLMVAAPWYTVLTIFQGRDEEGLTFRQRFWEHDHFGRVGSGVHGDKAGLGYFFEQLNYGMFPWFSVVPLSLGLAARTASDETVELQRRRIALFVLLWAVWTYTFFCVSQTKFHHYIFPAVPAFAILAAHWLGWAAEAPGERLKKIFGLVIISLFVVALRDILNEPQTLVNLFTYKYDRDFPREINPQLYIGIIMGAGALVTVLLFAFGRKGHALLSFFLMSCVFGAWVSHHHFNMLSPHWSQAHLFKTFYAEKKKDEPIYAYQLNWRGETFYSRNKVLQVKEGGADQRIRELVDQPGRKFIITEQSRFHTLKSALSPAKRDKLQIIDKSNNKFYLCIVED